MVRALAALALIALLGSCSGPPSVLDQILELGELRVVTRDSPMTFYLGSDAPRGIEYELARGFAARLGVDLKISVENRVSELLPDVGSGRAHIAAAALTVTSPRRELVTFGPAYERVEQQVVHRRGKKAPKSLADLADGRIEVAAGSAQAALLEQARGDAPGLIWREDPRATVEELVRRVSEGTIDYTIVPSNAFALLRHSYPEAEAAFALGGPEPVAWAVPKGAVRLRERIAAYFAEIRATGELQRIIERYSLPARDFDYVGSRAFLRHIETRLPSYRPYFEEAARETGIDWRLLAAIGYQESHWDPAAVSPTGVRGVMMLTGDTAGMMEVENRRDARESILGGARYLRRVLHKIPARISYPDRDWLAIAAYNIGFGHLEDARIITEIQGANPDRWDQVRRRLPLLADEAWYSRVKRGYATGAVAVSYVDNVRRYYELLQWMTDREVMTEYVESPRQRGPEDGKAG
ncbi:MAG TPA: membrane-bound lytic murein transglycosylase MltF [Gammaproteobacteria bacterium]|nr:membrane-bound lytic murein transglycosylase MltF [Gammaproteobacteria bacterium]